VLSVNLAELRDLRVLDGRTVRTGLFKEPVQGPVLALREMTQFEALPAPAE